MSGVSKKDMHVSFKGNRIVVTWRRVRVVETMEDGVRVRERKEKQYNQTIPLPEGTQVRFQNSTQSIYIADPCSSPFSSTRLEQHATANI